MTFIAPADQDWGRLSEPIHIDAATSADPVWKDNAFLAFWDIDAQVFGSLHVSTSPNAPSARRARFSLSVAGSVVEIVEPLGADSFDSDSIHFGLDGRAQVRHPSVEVDLVATALFTPVDYSTTDLIPALVPGKPLQHFERACTVGGEVRIGETVTPIAGHGMRDRTWGFRDESAQWLEYAALVTTTDTTFVSVLKFLGADGTQNAHGFLVEDSQTIPVTDVSFARNAAAQLLWARLALAGGGERIVRMHTRHGGFWVPMGPAETEKAAFGTYDDFMTLDNGSGLGGGFCEQGIVHRVV